MWIVSWLLKGLLILLSMALLAWLVVVVLGLVVVAYVRIKERLRGG